MKLGATIRVLDDPSYLDPTLQHEIAANLHPPSSPRVTCVGRLVQINEDMEFGAVSKRLGRGEGDRT